MKALQRKHQFEEENGKYNNLFFMCVDAKKLGECFARGEVDKIFLNFSDPWPKARYAKRRLTSPDFMAVYDQILKEDGVVEFKTDNVDLFAYSLEAIPEAGWEIIYQTTDFHAQPECVDNILTEYEEKFSKRGQKICKLIARRKSKISSAKGNCFCRAYLIYYLKREIVKILLLCRQQDRLRLSFQSVQMA